MVGFFVFFDYMGLVEFDVGIIEGDVCLYFYIGLVIVIYLFLGVMMYCDSLGVV